MRREERNYNGKNNQKRIIFLVGAFFTLAIITFIISCFIYDGKEGNKTQIQSEDSLLGMVNQEQETNTKQVTSEIGNKINNNESISNIAESSKEKNEVQVVEIKKKDDNVKKNVIQNETNNNRKINETNNDNQEKEEKEEVIELHFAKPVEGDVIKTFAKDNLVYSETLKEWTTHEGIDIRANKTTVVKSSEAGTVKSIKNDPRFGLTIIVEHVNGYKTVYANLLSTEFVIEGEEVEKGQSLGTVGNTASFEISEPSHLHFEMLMDEEPIDPLLYFEEL